MLKERNACKKSSVVAWENQKPRQQVVQMRVPSTDQTSACVKLIHISGTAMCQQLLEVRALDHELASIIIRRYTQSDQEANSECPCMKWRHNMEPEFATIVLADHEYVTNISIQY